MPLLGDLERFVATTLYPFRFLIAAITIAAIAVLVVVAVRRGWVAAARRHPVRSGVLVAAVLIVLAPTAWYLGSPLFIRTELREPPPVAVVASPSAASPSAASPSAASPSAASPSAAATGASPTPQPAVASATPAPTPSPTATVRSGTFTGADDFHFGRGRAILTEAADGNRSLRFEGFSVRNGPDLYVYLSPDPAGYTDGAVELGRLRATDGDFNTPIPSSVDLSKARSVVIWCREFAVQFAVALLRG